MVSIMEIMQLCRLCLVKEQVNIPIFEEQDDVRQICLKITSCLPVKITKEDKLPKKICDGCLYKLELLYQFYNTTANAEKQLLTWIEQINMDANEKNLENLAAQSTPPTVKQEKLEPVESTNENPDMSAEAQNYMLDQETFQPDFTFKESQGSTADAVDAAENSDEPLAKRPRRGRPRQATKPIPPESLDSSDNDNDNDDAGDSMLEMTVTKTEEESESEGEENVDDPEPTKFEAVGEDTEQPGPSGLGKGGADGPSQPRNFSSNRETQMKIEPLYYEDYTEPEQFTPEDDTTELHDNYISGDDDYISDDDVHISEEDEDVDYLPVKRSKGKKPRTSSKKKDSTSTKLKKEPLTYPCPKCDYFSENIFDLESHLKGHTKSKPPRPELVYNCGVCPKQYTTPSGLKAHMKSKHFGVLHTQGPLCDICGKRLSNAANLKDHKRLHTGEKPFSCVFCGKAFAKKDTMKQHERVHTSQRPHICRYCGKGFTQRSPLVIHERTHTGDMPYKCLMCMKGYPSKGIRDTHMKTCKGE